MFDDFDTSVQCEEIHNPFEPSAEDWAELAREDAIRTLLESPQATAERLGYSWHGEMRDY